METVNKPKKKEKRMGREILSWAGTLAAALVIALVIRSFVFTLIAVKGKSMQETLQNGDRLYVSILTARISGYERGDVVICRSPGRGRQLFVKRAVGLPGDAVWRTDGVTYVNGVPLEAGFRRFLPDYPPYTLGRDEYFCVGDNRRTSHDSRDWRRKGSRIVGPVDGYLLAGVVRCVLWPPRAMGRVSRQFAPEAPAKALRNVLEMGDDGRT